MNTNKAKKRRKKNPFDSISYTTGDLGLNINKFNQAMGTAEGSEAGIGGEGSLVESEVTTEDIDFLVENWWKEIF